MENEALKANAEVLEREYRWFRQVLEWRLRNYFQQDADPGGLQDLPPPGLEPGASLYARIVGHYAMGTAERLLLLLALAPHVRPQALDFFFTKNSLYDRGYSEFGGWLGQSHGGFLPTGETALFLIGGDRLADRFCLLPLFDADHYFHRHNILKLDTVKNHEPRLSGALQLSEEYLRYFTTGETYRPSFSANFPAKRITTPLEWEDLVLAPFILHEIGEIQTWLEQHETIRQRWGLARRVQAGYRVLFYGPPGTGKTLTAALLGKSTGLEVYRVDLSQIISKYIGETEKNLANVFDQAENRNWILFFDEADALFGKRTSTKDAHDRYANQEVAYLLQRIEDFSGVVILATNLKGNIDAAFARRFQSMIYFAMPDEAQRRHLWEKAFRGNIQLADDIDWGRIAAGYEISGGGIVNVLRYASLTALRKGREAIQAQDILGGIQREMRKEGKTG